MRLSFGFGAGTQEVEVPDQNLLGVLKANQSEKTALSGAQEVERALEHPIGTGRIEEVFSPGEKVAVITSDITRPCPSWAASRSPTP